MELTTNLVQYCLGISILLISFSPVHGQIVNEKYRTESIYFEGRYYVKNGTKYPITSWGKELKKEMEVSPDAVMEYQNFLQNRKAAFFLYTIGTASMVSSFFVANDGFQKGLFLGGTALAIVSLPKNNKASKSLQKAIWLRNGAILN